MPTRPHLKILLVDDSEICRDMAQLMLSQAGFTVMTIDSPLGFSKTLLQERPDLALVDVSMPALNGDLLVSVARPFGVRQRCPIVLFSAQPEDKLAALAGRCGADGYIRKSDNWPAIIRSIHHFKAQAK